MKMFWKKIYIVSNKESSMKKKLIYSIFVLLGVIFTFVPNVKVKAQDVASGNCGASGGNVTWVLDDEGVLELSGTGNMANYTSQTSVPWNSYKGSITAVSIMDGVASIGDYAFAGCTALNDIYFDGELSKVGNYAFFGCSGIDAIYLPAGATTIGKGAFKNCTNLSYIDLENRITRIEDELFYNSGIVEINIPDNLVYIGENAFAYSKIVNLYIPQSIETVGAGAFQGCEDLETIDCDACDEAKWKTMAEAAMLGSNVDVNFNHDYSCEREEAKYLESAATCEEPAYYCYSCLKCGAKGTDVFPVGEGKGHKIVVDKGREATCTQTGLSEGEHCSECGEIFVEQIETDAYGHDYEYKDDPAVSCENPRKRVYTCVECGHSYYKGLSHSVVTDKAVKATCLKPGKTEGSHCSRCKKVIKAQTTIAKLSHTVVRDKAVTATCTRKGRTAGSHCSKCNTVIKAQRTIPMLKHKYGKWKVTKKPTAKAYGKQVHTCSLCKKTESAKVAKLIKKTKTIAIGTKNKALITGLKSNQRLSCVSSDKNVATISSKGKITAKRYGKTTVTIKRTGSYNKVVDMYNYTVYVSPKTMSLQSVKSDKKGQLAVSWNKDSSVLGYNILISDNVKFSKTSSNTKEKYFDDINKLNIVINGIPSGKLFYVKIRSVVMVGNKSIYSDWSPVKAVIIK